MTTERIDIVINESGGRTVKRSLDDIADSAQRGERSLNSLNGGLGGASQASEILTSSLKALGLALGALRLTSLISEASRLSQRYSELGIVLDVVGRNAGLMKSEVDATTEAVRKQGISMIESRQIVARMIQSQIELSKATQLARLAQDAAVIGQINSSEALDRLVFGITSAQVEVLRGIGINVSFEQSYTKLAKEMGVTQNALTEQQKLQARLNVVLDEASKLNGVYAGSMENAGKQMRSTQRLVEDLKVKLGGLFDQTAIFAVTAYTSTLKDADAQMDAFTETGQIKAWGDAIARTAAFAADAVRSVGVVFDIAGKGLGAFAAQAVSISNLDFKGAAAIRESFSADFDAAIGSMSKMRDLVESQIVQRDMLTKSTERETLSLKSNTQTLDQNASAVKGNSKERDGFLKSLQNEVESIGKNEFALKRMQAAKLGAADAAEPLIATLEQENKRLNQQEIAVNSIISDLNKYKQVTESVMTDQERFAAQVEELNRLRNLTNGAAISEETYARALKKAQDEFDTTKKKGQETFEKLDQYAIQGARNIQTSLANFLFDPFDDGLKGMVKGVIDAVRRMVAEFAAMKIAQTIGLTSLFQGAGIAALGGSIIPSSSGSSSGGTSNLLNIASLGTNALSLFKGGFGLPGFIGNMGSSLPGSMGSFFTGMAGKTATQLAAETGAMSLWGASGASTGMAASMGSAFAAAAGPLMAAFVATQVGRMIAGDKRMGGGFGKFLNKIGDIPVLGDFMPGIPLLNALFGRSPYKFRRQFAIGTATAEGFDGRITDVYRSNGGLFLKNKYREQAAPNEAEILALFDTTIKGFGDSVKSFATNLGLSTDSITSFSKEINLMSERKQRLTEEQIQQMFTDIGNELAGGVIAPLGDVKKAGEDNMQALQRLSAEFDTLSLAAVATGKSVKAAREEILNLPIATRTSEIDQLGGVDAANQKINFFMSSFLSDAERLAPMIQSLDEKMKELGFSASITREDFKNLIQSVETTGGITRDQYVGLLSIAQEFDAVDRLRTQLSASTGVLISQERTLLDIRSELIATYQTEQTEISNAIDQFKNFADQIKGFREGLLLGELSPLTPAQRLEEARAQFNQVRLGAAAGDQNALAQLPNAAQEFLKASQTYNASSAAYISDFELVQNVLKDAEGSALTQIDLLQSQLGSLDDSVSNLIDINTNTKTTVDLLRELTIKTLSGAGNPGISTQEISAYLGANPGLTQDQVISQATKYGVSLQQLEAAGYGVHDINKSFSGVTVTDKQIRDFVSLPGITPMQIYDAAIANGITSQRLSSVTGIPMADIEKFVRDNGLQSFAKGTDFIAKSGLAMVHRAEAIVPSSTTEEIRKLREELVRLREEQNQQTADMINVTDITSRQNAKAIADAVAETEKRKRWEDRSKAKLA